MHMMKKLNFLHKNIVILCILIKYIQELRIGILILDKGIVIIMILEKIYNFHNEIKLIFLFYHYKI